MDGGHDAARGARRRAAPRRGRRARRRGWTRPCWPWPAPTTRPMSGGSGPRRAPGARGHASRWSTTRGPGSRAGTDRGWGIVLICGAGTNAAGARAGRPALAVPGRRRHRGRLGRRRRHRAGGAAGGGPGVGWAGARRTLLERRIPEAVGLRRIGRGDAGACTRGASRVDVRGFSPVVFRAAMDGDARRPLDHRSPGGRAGRDGDGDRAAAAADPPRSGRRPRRRGVRTRTTRVLRSGWRRASARDPAGGDASPSGRRALARRDGPGGAPVGLVAVRGIAAARI